MDGASNSLKWRVTMAEDASVAELHQALGPHTRGAALFCGAVQLQSNSPQKVAQLIGGGNNAVIRTAELATVASD